jgi:hypothetical protein
LVSPRALEIFSICFALNAIVLKDANISVQGFT